MWCIYIIHITQAPYARISRAHGISPRLCGFRYSIYLFFIQEHYDSIRILISSTEIKWPSRSVDIFWIQIAVGKNHADSVNQFVFNKKKKKNVFLIYFCSLAWSVSSVYVVEMESCVNHIRRWFKSNLIWFQQHFYCLQQLTVGSTHTHHHNNNNRNFKRQIMENHKMKMRTRSTETFVKEILLRIAVHESYQSINNLHNITHRIRMPMPLFNICFGSFFCCCSILLFFASLNLYVV